MKRIVILLLLICGISLGSNIEDTNTNKDFNITCIDSKLYIKDLKLNTLTSTEYSCSYNGKNLKIENDNPIYITIAKVLILMSLTVAASILLLSIAIRMSYSIFKNKC